jgi:hypothetical protein
VTLARSIGGSRLLQRALRLGGIGVERASHLAVVGERVQRAGITFTVSGQGS